MGPKEYYKIILKARNMKLTNSTSVLRRWIEEISLLESIKSQLLETIDSSWLLWSRAWIANAVKLIFEFSNNWLLIFKMLVVAEPNPETEYINLQIKLAGAAANLGSIDKMLAPSALVADRAISCLPSCHRHAAYICNPSRSSWPIQ